MITVLAILFHREVRRDTEHLRRIFLAAMAATGSDTHDRKPELFDNGDDGFHFVIWGEEALDCHVYHAPLFESMWAFPDTIAGQPRAKFLKPPLTTFIIEGSPQPFPKSLEASRRVALAAADLLDPSAFALIEMHHGLLIPVSPSTAALLRSADPETAFAGSLALTKRTIA